MPRWAPLVLCVLYVIAGLLGREPWRTQDAAGFGVAHTMASGAFTDWLIPNVHGQMVSSGPLPGWLGALAIGVARLFPAGWVADDLAVRVLAGLQLAATLALLWYAVLALARRPQVQPEDPFGITPSRKDFARAIADTTLLAALATIGLVARVHETTPDALQMLWVALWLFALALALERPGLGGMLTGCALAATLLTKGLPLTAALVSATVTLLLAIPAWRLIARPFTAAMLPTVLLLGSVWPATLAVLAWADRLGTVPFPPELQRAARAYWLNWTGTAAQSMAGWTQRSLVYYARNGLWILWPLWPLVLRGVWVWRSKRREPLVALPIALMLYGGVLALLDPIGGEASLLPLILPCAVLAAIALPSIPRGMSALIDWFAICVFSVAGLFVWSYWVALMTGFPPKMANSVERLVPGFEARLSWVELVFGLLASVCWFLLVRWRLSRPRRPIWAPMSLSAGGVVLTWFLLMTLWLPAANYRSTYQHLAGQTRHWFTTGGCTRPVALDPGQRALFAYFAGARFIPVGSNLLEDNCPFLLISEHGSELHRVQEVAPGNWTLYWKGQPPIHRGERLYLYVRTEWLKNLSR